MMILSDYIKYIKDNPQGYWFKPKWYGWGWTPATWQGFLVIFIYLAIILAPGILFSAEIQSGEQYSRIFTLVIIVSTAFLIWICIKKGQKPHWNWGIPRKK